MINQDIRRRILAHGSRKLFIEPLLEDSQIGKLTIDLRLGCEFLVSIVTRRPFIGIIGMDEKFQTMTSYFKSTSRELGQRFILYPNQTVLATTLEYIGIPSDCYANLLTRSSYARLGISISGTIIEPSFRGCFTIELFNHGNNPIELVVGARLFQMKLTEITDQMSYRDKKPKYIGNIRPIPSRAADDPDLIRLNQISESSLINI